MTADDRQPHILIINDTPAIRELLQELLEEEGYRVTTSVALLDMDKVKVLAPDIIVQDLLFEDTQELVWKTLHLLCMDPELARIPIVLCTAAVSVVRDAAMAEQLDRLKVRVVLKPFHIDQVLEVLKDAQIAPGLINQARDG